MMYKCFPRIWYGVPTRAIECCWPWTFPTFTISVMSQLRRLPKVRIYFLYMCGAGLCRFLCIYTILTGHANLANDSRGVLLVRSYICPFRTKT